VDWVDLTLERERRVIVNAIPIKMEDFFLSGCGTVIFSGTLLHGGRRFTENWNGVEKHKVIDSCLLGCYTPCRLADVDVSEERSALC